MSSFLHALRLSVTESGFLSEFAISFLVRPGCHLCDDARPLVDWASRKSGVEIVEVDVDQDDSLVGLYGLRIPVVLDREGNVLAEGLIDDRRALRRAIRKSLRA